MDYGTFTLKLRSGQTPTHTRVEEECGGVEVVKEERRKAGRSVAVRMDGDGEERIWGRKEDDRLKQ